VTTDTARPDIDAGFTTGERPSWAWIWQAGTGVALLILLTVHMIAHHFIVEGGLRTYAQVVDYLRSPVIFVTEHLFLGVVTLHAMLGVRAVALDLGLSPRAERRVTTWLTGVGLVTVAYGVWLLWTVTA
jgi:succinate dehydrogenase hydrophobic anchor subunit